MNVSVNEVNTDCEKFWQENKSYYMLECDLVEVVEVGPL